MTFEIKFFNTLTHQKEILHPLNPNDLKLYVCGPTVYDRPHLGNARSVVIYDLLFRFLKKVFPKVTYVRNITDVDDKINAAAKERKISIQQLTEEIISQFYADIDTLNVLRPTIEPRATQHISEMITMIEKLIANGHAYVNQGHVLFDVNSYKKYGSLSNRNLDDLVSGARVEIADYKKNPLDFVLWKPADAEDDISSIFESPWGKGRPGWHIECSAMSSKYLGENFDIHGGGADLQFPHHENEIAQSCCANEGSNYANYWIHNGFLTVNGEKMSKSLKNFFTVRELLEQGRPAIAIRFLLLATHYRKPCDFNEEALNNSIKTIEKFYSVLSEENIQNSANYETPSEILEYLADDLNIAKSIALLHELVKEAKSSDLAKEKLAACLDLLGLIDVNFLKKSANNSGDFDEKFIQEQIDLRIKYKLEKNYAKADEIRKNLLEMGIVLEDVGKDKTIWHRNND